jgi:hypothetical protein
MKLPGRRSNTAPTSTSSSNASRRTNRGSQQNHKTKDDPSTTTEEEPTASSSWFNNNITPTSPTNASNTSDVEMTSLDLQFQTHGASLPTPEDFGIVSSSRGDMDQKKRRRRKCWIAGGVIGLVLAIGAVVGTVVGVTTANQKESKSSNSNTNQEKRAVSANAPAADVIVNWLSERDISDATAMSTPGTPQYQAVQWLRTRTDPVLPTPGDLNFFKSLDLAAYKYAASYVLAVLFYNTGGPDTWGVSHDFLGNDDICEWSDLRQALGPDGFEDEMGGVICDPRTKIPYVLDLGTFCSLFLFCYRNNNGQPNSPAS